VRQYGTVVYASDSLASCTVNGKHLPQSHSKQHG